MKLKNYILILLQAINLSHSGLNNIYEKNLQGVFSALVNDTSNNIFTPKVLKSLKEEVDKKIMSTQEETVFDSLKDELKKQTYFQLAFLKPDQQNLEEWSENLSTSILDFYNIDPSKKAKKIAIKGIAWDYLLTIFFEQKKSEEKRYTDPPNTDKN